MSAKPSIVVSHPTGNNNVRYLIENFHRQGSLRRFETCLSFSEDSVLTKSLPPKLAKQVKRRSYQLPPSSIRRHPLREATRQLASILGSDWLTQPESGFASIDAVYKHLDEKVGAGLRKEHASGGAADCVYCYEDGGESTFKVARELGITTAYELPIAYWETLRSILQDESKRLPKWSQTLGGGITDSSEKLERKTRELELADRVIVPSQFVASSLPGWAADKPVHIAPFGSPPPLDESILDRISEEKLERAKAGKPLRVLFVGSLGQRKGLADLYEAVRMLGRNVELILMGKPLCDRNFYSSQGISVTLESSRPHSEVLELMQSCDVFCLPSLVEGRALVMQEAMSQGLPLVITPNTGGQDLVEDRSTGFLVPICDAVHLSQKLQWFLDNRDSAVLMGREARTVSMEYTWNSYADGVLNFLREKL